MSKEKINDLNITEADLIIRQNTFAEHGNEIEDIISRRPPFIVRWGTLFFAILLVMIGFISWFIEYPDIVNARAKLNSINAPLKVITKTDGKLNVILVKENKQVDSGQLLGYMESIADPASVQNIAVHIDSMNKFINQNKTDEIIHYFPDYNGQRSPGNLGELQIPYQSFIQSFIVFRDFLSSGIYLRKKNMLLADMQNLQKLHNNATNQKQLYQQDLSLSNETFKANQTLVDQKVISPLEYRNEKSKLIAKQLSLPQVNASIISNESQQIEKSKEIAELENMVKVEKSTFLQALQTMKSQVESWQAKYLLKAPISGRVSFAGFLQEKQEMKNGEVLFHIQPANTSYFIEMLIPQYNSGKVKSGQKVILRFPAYPEEQYGAVIGKIENIKSAPTDSGFLARVSLPHGLKTNYNKQLQYRDGLIAKADIVTEDMRLLERFYNNLRKQIKR